MTTRAEAEKEAGELFGVSERIIVMSKFNPVPFSQELLKNNHLIYDNYKRFWRYDNLEGIWRNDAEQFIKTELRKNLFGDEQQKKSYVDEILAYLKDSQYKDNFQPDNNPYLIAFKNKVFDLRDKQFKEFSPDYFITNKIPIEIDETLKECPVIDKFFAESVSEEYKDILYDLASYCLFRQYPYQKLFFIYGPAGTGKSKYLNLLEAFLGRENYCSVEPQSIQKDPYAAAQMWLKSANIVSDINYDSLDNINQVKKITGGDTMKIRQMYRDPFNEKLYAKQIYSTNKLPIVKEKTRAWYRRVYPIEFRNIVQKDKVDPFILSKMTTKEELGGFAMKCIEKLCDMRDNKFIFTWDIDDVQVADMYEQLSNPILMFIKENCLESKGTSSHWVYKFEFKNRLNNWLYDKHFPRMTDTQINEFMRDNFNESNRSSFNGDKTYRVWVGLKWGNSSHNPDILNQFNHFTGVWKKVYIYRKCFQNPCKSVKPVKSISPQETEVFNQ